MKESEIFNICNPVVGVYVFPGGVVVVKRESRIQGRFDYDRGRKERPIMKFTPKSMARLVATVNATNVYFSSMLTLTYPRLYPKDGRQIKEAMNNFLQMLRDLEWGNYLWFLEFQVRGAPHFHVLLETKTISPQMRIRVAETWVGHYSKADWFSDQASFEAVRTDRCHWELMSKTLAKAYYFVLRPETWEVLRDRDGARKYTTKYAAKEYQKEVPKDFKGVGRFWGCSRPVSLGEGIYREMEEGKLRRYLASTEHATANWEVLPKYLFNVRQEVPVEAEPGSLA